MQEFPLQKSIHNHQHSSRYIGCDMMTSSACSHRAKNGSVLAAIICCYSVTVAVARNA